MTSDRSILERQMAGVELRPFTLDEFHRRRHRKQRNRRIGTTLMGLVLAAAAIGGVLRTVGSDSGDTTVTADDVAGPSVQPNPFVGTWMSTDADGSTQTMEIRRAGGDEHEVVVRDEAAGVCSGAPSTMTGTGRLSSAGELDLPQPVLVCDDGSTPAVESGPPLDEQLANLTFVHDPARDELVDSLGVVWRRQGAASDQVDPPQVVHRMVEAVNARDADAFIDAFAPDGGFAPRGDFAESSSLFGNHQPVADVELVGAWMAIVDAWGLEAELTSCAHLTVPAVNMGDGVDAVVECEVATRWHTLSMEITESWYFELHGTELLWWDSISCCRRDLDLLDLDPPDRTLPLGYDGLEAWEGWLQTNHPEDAARFLNPRAGLGDCDGCAQAEASLAPGDPDRAARLAPLVSHARDDWVIDGHRFTPIGLIPYDLAFAGEIESSIHEYLEGQ